MRGPRPRQADVMQDWAKEEQKAQQNGLNRGDPSVAQEFVQRKKLGPRAVNKLKSQGIGGGMITPVDSKTKLPKLPKLPPAVAQRKEAGDDPEFFTLHYPRMGVARAHIKGCPKLAGDGPWANDGPQGGTFISPGVSEKAEFGKCCEKHKGRSAARRKRSVAEPGFHWSKHPSTTGEEFTKRMAKGAVADDVFRAIIAEIDQHHQAGKISTRDARRSANEALGRLLKGGSRRQGGEMSWQERMDYINKALGDGEKGGTGLGDYNDDEDFGVCPGCEREFPRDEMTCIERGGSGDLEDHCDDCADRIRDQQGQDKESSRRQAKGFPDKCPDCGGWTDGSHDDDDCDWVAQNLPAHLRENRADLDRRMDEKFSPGWDRGPAGDMGSKRRGSRKQAGDDWQPVLQGKYVYPGSEGFRPKAQDHSQCRHPEACVVQHPELLKGKKQATRKEAWFGWGPALKKQHHAEGWDWDNHLNGYVSSKSPRQFQCACGNAMSVPGYTNCKCGKIWNSYVIGTGGDRHEAAAEKFICREIPVRSDVIVASKRKGLTLKLRSTNYDDYDPNSMENTPEDDWPSDHHPKTPSMGKGAEDLHRGPGGKFAPSNSSAFKKKPSS